MRYSRIDVRCSKCSKKYEIALLGINTVELTRFIKRGMFNCNDCGGVPNEMWVRIR